MFKPGGVTKLDGKGKKKFLRALLRMRTLVYPLFCVWRTRTCILCLPTTTVNLEELEEAVKKLINNNVKEEDEVVDLLPMQEERLVVCCVMTSPKAKEQEDGHRKGIFRIGALCNGKTFKIIIDIGSTKNMISKEAVTKLKLLWRSNKHSYKISWFRIGKVPIVSHCLIKFSTVSDLKMRFGEMYP